jgi:hypothetical protein
MPVSRRRLFQSLALTAGYGAAVEGTESAITLAVLRDVSAVHGTDLSDDRLRVVKPVLEHSLPQLQALRDFEVDAAIAPTQGILDKCSPQSGLRS